MIKMKKSFLIVVLLYPSLSLIPLVQAQKTEPNAAELVRAVRESENWIHKVESFQLRTESVWTTPREPNEAEMKAAGGRPYKSGTKDFLEFAFNNKYIRYQSGGDEKSDMLRIWDGEKAISHEKSPDNNEEQYYLAAKTEELFDTMFASISWLRSQPHSFWFDIKDVNERMKSYGYTEEFVFNGQQNYRGIDCYLLVWKPREGIYYATDISFRWYVGVNDKLLHGLVTMYGDKVNTEHYMLDYQEVAPSCWFPMKQGYEINSHWETLRDIKVVKVQINEKLPEEMFQIELQEGVEVIDNRSGQRITYIYKAPLVGNPFPSLEEISIDFDRSQAPDNPILFCFFDIEQRPSRNCILQLSKRAQVLRAKNIVLVAVQASKIERPKLDEWIKDNNIPFPVGMIEGDSEKTRFNWGVKSLPWLILTDKSHIVTAEGFGIDELDEKTRELENADKLEVQKKIL